MSPDLKLSWQDDFLQGAGQEDCKRDLIHETRFHSSSPLPRFRMQKRRGPCRKSSELSQPQPGLHLPF